MRRLSRGFTVIELMVSLVVVAILASLALPAFQGTLERTKADTDMGELHRALSSARLEAINRSMSMSVVAVDGDWGGELEIRTGDGSDPDDVVRKLPGMAPGAAVTATGDVETIQFNSLGGLESPAAAVLFDYSRGDSAKSMSVCPTGRIIAGDEC